MSGDNAGKDLETAVTRIMLRDATETAVETAIRVIKSGLTDMGYTVKKVSVQNPPGGLSSLIFSLGGRRDTEIVAFVGYKSGQSGYIETEDGPMDNAAVDILVMLPDALQNVLDTLATTRGKAYRATAELIKGTIL